MNTGIERRIELTNKNNGSPMGLAFSEFFQKNRTWTVCCLLYRTVHVHTVVFTHACFCGILWVRRLIFSHELRPTTILYCTTTGIHSIPEPISTLLNSCEHGSTPVMWYDVASERLTFGRSIMQVKRANCWCRAMGKTHASGRIIGKINYVLYTLSRCLGIFVTFLSFPKGQKRKELYSQSPIKS